MRFGKFFTVLGMVGLLCGCSFDVDVYEPVEAPRITNTLSVNHLWDRSIGSGVGHFYSRLSPAVDDKKVYAASRNGDVYAFDKYTGSKFWHTDISDEDENDNRRSVGLSGGITLGDGYIYIPAENGYVYALNAEDGELYWKHNIGTEIIAATAYDYDKLYVMTSSGHLYALNSSNGEEIWSTGNDSKILALRGSSAPVVINNEVVAYGSVDGKLNFINTQLGVLIKQVTIGVARGATQLSRLNDVVSSPVVISNEVYAVGISGELKGIELPQFSNIWSRNYASYQDLAYDLSDIAVTDRNGHVHAVIRMDGSERWVNSALTYRLVTAPAYLGDYVLVGDYEGYLYFLDGVTGHFVYQEQVDSSGIYVAPVISDDIAYVVTRNGELHAYSLKSKKDFEENVEE